MEVRFPHHNWDEISSDYNKSCMDIVIPRTTTKKAIENYTPQRTTHK